MASLAAWRLVPLRLLETYCGGKPILSPQGGSLMQPSRPAFLWVILPLLSALILSTACGSEPDDSTPLQVSTPALIPPATPRPTNTPRPRPTLTPIATPIPSPTPTLAPTSKPRPSPTPTRPVPSPTPDGPLMSVEECSQVIEAYMAENIEDIILSATDNPMSFRYWIENSKRTPGYRLHFKTYTGFGDKPTHHEVLEVWPESHWPGFPLRQRRISVLCGMCRCL